MWFTQSARYLPSSEWADALKVRALSVPPEHDLQAGLEAFRQHDAFYAERLAGVANWQDIPWLQKAELASVPVNTNEELHETRSSGTTGVQAVVRNTVSERRFRQALAYRPLLFYPLTPAAENVIRQVIFVDGHTVEPADKQQWPFEFGGRRYLTWHVGIAAPPQAIHALLQSVRPQVLRGLTSGLVRYAEELPGSLQPSLSDLGVQVVSPSGEHLSADWRTCLHTAFAAPVLDRYGATETGSMAWQCPYCNDYHLNSDEVIVEASDAGVLATPLFIESQPLLRYRLDDRIQLNAASGACQIRLPTMTVLEARRDDWIIDGAGLKVSPLSFQFERIAGLKAWRLHQLDTGALRLYFETTADVEPAAADIPAQLAQQLQEMVAGRDYEVRQGIWGTGQAGKFRRVTSNMRQP